jgi:large subunit ribosomal protein L36
VLRSFVRVVRYVSNSSEHIKGLNGSRMEEILKRREANCIQSVRRKGGKSGKGHVYIICSLNPKHKQRQGK